MHRMSNLSYKGRPQTRLTPQLPYPHLPPVPNWVWGQVRVQGAQNLLQQSPQLSGNHPHLPPLILGQVQFQIQGLGSQGPKTGSGQGLAPIPEGAQIVPEATPQTAIQIITAGQLVKLMGFITIFPSLRQPHRYFIKLKFIYSEKATKFEKYPSSI